MSETDLNLEQLRKRAKELLRSARAGGNPQLAPDARLADAQHLIAKEAGYASWARLKHAVEAIDAARDATRADLATGLIGACLGGDAGRAAALLAEDPRLAGFDLATALCAADLDTVAEAIEEDRSVAITPIVRAGFPGLRPLPPIIVLTRSALASREADTGERAAVLRLLIEAGADANTAVPFDPPYQSSAGTPLYYAAAVAGNHELTRILLDAGATPNDGETLYHLMERGDPELLRRVHAAGVDRAQWSYAIIHLMDFESPEMLRMAIELGGIDFAHRHPQTGETILHWAIKRGRSAEVLRLLLEAGADPSLTDYHGGSAYALAVCCGHSSGVEIMASRGYREALSPADELVLAASMEDAARVAAIKAAEPSVVSQLTRLHRMSLVRAAEAGNLGAVRGLIRLAGINPGERDGAGVTALHNAALYAHLDVVRLLVEAGAPLDCREHHHDATPLGWACWASANPPFSARDHGPVVELLLSAGSPRPTEALGSETVRVILRKYGVQ